MSGFVPHTVRVRPALALGDLMLLAGAGWLAHSFRFQGPMRLLKLAEIAGNPLFLVVAGLVLLALAAAGELYEPLLLRRRREVAVRVWIVAAAWAAALAIATYLVPAWQFGRGLLLLTLGLWAVPATSVRLVLAHWLARRERPRALIVGEPAAVARTFADLSRHPFSPWEPLDGSRVPAGRVAAEVEASGAVLVVLSGTETAGATASDLAALHFSGVPVVVASEVWAWLDGRLPVRQLSPVAFLHQPGFGAVHWALFNRLTRVIDIVLAAVLLVVASPLLALAALAVRILDGAPVLFLQMRVGQFGRGFRVVKLRTMTPDAEDLGPVFAAKDDPRVTRVGRVLRRLRLDELPQLVNVLRGQMSLVGPRPERPEFVSDLTEQIPYYTFRLAVPPGLTGWAQVNLAYCRTLDEHRRKLEYDLFFIRERSVSLYLVILLRTLAVALLGVRDWRGIGASAGAEDVSLPPAAAPPPRPAAAAGPVVEPVAPGAASRRPARKRAASAARSAEPRS